MAVPEPEPVAAEPLPVRHGMCDPHGWCWVSPLPQGRPLHDIQVLSPSDLWVVGEHGTVMHWDGSEWAGEIIAETTLRRVWTRADEVWAIGDEGTVARRHDGRWELLATDTDADLYTIAEVGAEFGEQLWFAGAGTVLRWDGHALARETSFPSQQTTAIHVGAAGDIWLAGLYLERFDGEAWTRDETLGFGDCMAIHVFAPDDLWCAGDTGTLLRSDTNGWWRAVEGKGLARYRSADDLGEDVGIRADSWRDDAHTRFIAHGTDLYVTGSSSTLRFDGERWQDHAQLPRYMNTSTVAESGEVFAVGVGGRVVRGRGREWTDVSAGLRLTNRRVAASPEGVIVGGYADDRERPGKLARLVDGTLVSTDEDGPIDGLFGRPDDLWAVGLDGEIRHFDGSTWTSMPTGTTVQLRGLWIGDKGDDGWAVGEGGTILRYTSGRWAAVASPVTGLLWDVWAAGPERAWAVGADAKKGVILGWDGRSWTVIERPARELRSIDGVDAEHVWVGGWDTLLSWDGQRWSPQPGSPTPDLVVGIEALAPDDVWVAARSQVHHFDGEAWATNELGGGLSSIAADEHRVWVVGMRGDVRFKLRAERPNPE